MASPSPPYPQKARASSSTSELVTTPPIRSIRRAYVVAVFAQHVPTEFERDQHYLKDSAGTDIEPVAQESSGAHDHGHHDEHGDEGEIEAGEGEEEFDYDPHS